MKVTIDLPDDEVFSPHDLANMLVEVGDGKYKVAVFTWDRKLTPMTQLLMEKDA